MSCSVKRRDYSDHFEIRYCENTSLWPNHLISTNNEPTLTRAINKYHCRICPRKTMLQSLIFTIYTCTWILVISYDSNFKNWSLLEINCSGRFIGFIAVLWRITYNNIEHEFLYIQITGAIYIAVLKYVEYLSFVQLFLWVSDESLEK